MTSSHARTKRVAGVLALLLLAASANSQGGNFIPIPADVRITFTGTPLDHIVPGEQIAASIVITNLGPGVVQSLGVQSSEFINEWQIGSIGCTKFFPEVLDGNNGFSYKFEWIAVGVNGQVQELDVGQSLTCNITLSLTSAAPPRYAISFGLDEIFTDINPLNDSGTITIQQQIADVPAATTLSLSILSLLLLMFAFVRMRHCSNALELKRPL